MSTVRAEHTREGVIQELTLAAKYAQVVREAAEERLCSAVLAAAAAGMTQREIGAVLGCSQPEIHRILRRAKPAAVPTPPAQPRRRSGIRFASSSPLGRLLIANRDEVLEIAARHHATNVKVFGSVARGEDDDRSDIDLLADFTSTNAFDQVAMARKVEELLGVPVDVGTPDALRPRLREEVLREAISL